MPFFFQKKGPIMDAASAITDAAMKLVKSATDAQKERVAQGKLPNSQSSYKLDPAWSEGAKQTFGYKHS